MLQVIPEINGLYEKKEGCFILPEAVSMSNSFANVNRVFESRIRTLGNYKVCEDLAPVISYIQTGGSREAYRLEIMEDKIGIYAAGEAGYSHGLVTLFQMLSHGKGKAACCNITDEPKFEKRGFMLDVCRHFFPAEEVKKILEQCALFKLNHFHWHLGDDQGFRIESRRYPKLNKISPFRKLDNNDPAVLKGLAKAGEEYGGYYSQEEIRDIIAFAADRQIDIVPEIDLPGHSSAILAAYPEFTCSGEPLEVKNTFGIHERIFCAGNQNGIQFLWGLLDEISDLFPSDYIHIGGDEAPKTEWHSCEACNQVMKEQGYDNYEKLQAYFTGKLIEQLKKKGKTPIVWNESAASGELDKEAVVQYWMEMAPGPSYVLPEVHKGRKFILSSMNNFYCDYSYAEIPLKATLLYEPELKGTLIPEENVLGIEAPMWTEWTPTKEDVEKMIYPRLAAVAENGWTRNRDIDGFLKRLEAYLKISGLNILEAMPWEAATVHGQEALDMIVEKMLELSARFTSMSKEEGGKVEAVMPEGAEKINPLDMAKGYVYNKMRAAYSNEEIEQVTNRLLAAMAEGMK